MLSGGKILSKSKSEGHKQSHLGISYNLEEQIQISFEQILEVMTFSNRQCFVKIGMQMFQALTGCPMGANESQQKANSQLLFEEMNTLNRHPQPERNLSIGFCDDMQFRVAFIPKLKHDHPWSLMSAGILMHDLTQYHGLDIEYERIQQPFEYLETHTSFTDESMLHAVVRHKDKNFDTFKLQTVFPNNAAALRLCKITSMGTILRIIDNSSLVEDAIHSITIELFNQLKLSKSFAHINSILRLLYTRAKAGRWKDDRRSNFVIQHFHTILSKIQQFPVFV